MKPSLKRFLESDQDGAFCVGHASVLCRLDGTLFFFDPVFGDYSPYGEHWVFWPEQVDCREIIAKIPHLIVSHIHRDHLCAPVLKKAKGLVHIMDGRPRIEEALTDLSCSVMRHKPWKWTKITETVDILWVPHPTNNVDSLPIICGKNTVISLGSDCFLDKESVSKLAIMLPKLDIAFVPYAFIFWWPFLQKNMQEERKRKETARLVEQSANQAREFCAALNPKFAIGTGADLYYAGGARHLLNRHLLVSGMPEPLKQYHAGDYLLLGNGLKPTYRFNGAFDGESFPSPAQEPLNFLTAGVRPAAKDLKRIAAGLMGSPKAPGWEILINEISIDCETRTVGWYGRGMPKNFYNFEVDKPVYELWLRGKIRFEELLGTRRFLFSRSPDIYKPEIFTLFNEFL